MSSTDEPSEDIYTEGTESTEVTEKSTG